MKRLVMCAQLERGCASATRGTGLATLPDLSIDALPSPRVFDK